MIKLFLNTNKNDDGFTMAEIVMVSLISSLMIGGIWSVYFTIVNTYYNEQRNIDFISENERIIKLMTNGGFCAGEEIFGISASFPDANYPMIGHNISITNGDTDDYRIIFKLDNIDENQRFGEFYIDFDNNTPTSKLNFRLVTKASDGSFNEEYDVIISENILQRKRGSDMNEYGGYDDTWFKAERLIYNSDYYGITISWYLVDTNRPLEYNFCLDRRLTSPVNDAGQRKNFLDGIPYPVYCSTIINFKTK